MKLSARCRYAARILVELAKQNQNVPISASVLSQRTEVSAQFIEQILKPFKKKGITQSFRGTSGGHCLAMPAEEITLGVVVRLMEGGVTLAMCCSNGPNKCPIQDSCLTRSAWQKISKAVERELDAISLSDLLKDANTHSRHSFLNKHEESRDISYTEIL